MTSSRGPANPRVWGLLAAMGLIGLFLLMMFPNRPPISHPAESLAHKLKQASYKQSDRLFLVNLWALWCEPCKKEIPDLVKLAQQNQKIELRLIQMDAPQKANEGLAWLKTVKADLFLLDKTPESFSDFFSRLGTSTPAALPETYILKNGEVLHSWTGSRSFEEMMLELQPYFE